DTDGCGYAGRRLSATCQKNNIPYKMTTLQMAGYVAADKAGTVLESEAAPSSRWKEVKFKKDTALTLEPDITDNYVYMDEYVNYLVKTLGDSTTSTGIQAYSLDNEPVLWNDTHPLLHSNEVSSKELISKSIELASVVKDIDPNAEVFGPAFWGMLPCINGSNSASDKNNNVYTDPDYDAVKGNYSWFMDYYLEQMANAEKESGKRLLDVVDVHFYSQDCSTEASRVQAARSLYDASYVENSWLQPTFGQYFPFLPKLQESIDKYYPGTKIAISEYNFADLSNEKESGKLSSAAIAEADALGCFADNNVYFATYWGTLSECPYAASAINLYTNYDGEGASFGDTLVESSTSDISLAYSYASIDGSDDSTVKTVLSNKSADQTEDAVITLDGTTKDYQSAVVYAITPKDDQIRIIDVQNDISGNQVKVELPPMSVAQVVVSDQKTDKEVYVKPEEPDTKTITYKYEDLELSGNGFPKIPLTDLEHLKKVIINTTVTCSTNADWYGGGGALAFNDLLLEDGTKAWASKAYSFGAGTNDNVILMDGNYTVNKEEVAGTPTQDYAELQGCWWKSSTNSESGEDVSVTFNSVSLVYEYEKDPDTTTTTTTTTTATTETETTTTLTETTPAETTAPEETTTSTEPTTSEPVETTTTKITTIPDANVSYGDVNTDGVVDLIDAIYLNKYFAGFITLTDTQMKNANVFVDENVNDDDIDTLMQFILLLVNDIPVYPQA
ncbi:MAG: glycoside hydrolase family 44 protein, partial [Ruminococcus sp.]|nr:glycoside hydrolase family 44 protein [Ruminococcus sp.]